MSDSKLKFPPGLPKTPGTAPAKAAPVKPGATATPAKPGAAPRAGEPTGKVVHDDRGNAVWDWLKQTSRIAIESTSRLLRRLEAPELKVEDTQDNELRLMPDGKNCAGGGYDPYNQTNKGKPPRK
ncbi:MAG TPA: hypothetical protein VEC10_15065 [Steroidobacteraceae bacterium]|nr:hypothetical protein [Steroidobacteraceae bacterium]